MPLWTSHEVNENRVFTVTLFTVFNEMVTEYAFLGYLVCLYVIPMEYFIVAGFQILLIARVFVTRDRLYQFYEYGGRAVVTEVLSYRTLAGSIKQFAGFLCSFCYNFSERRLYGYCAYFLNTI